MQRAPIEGDDMKQPDENDRLRAGALPNEPEDDAEPMPPPEAEGDGLPLDVLAPTMATAYGAGELEADRQRGLIRFAKLPPWWGDRGAPGHATDHGFGHGIGEHLESALGGGVRPGEMIGFGAASAGAGKTAFLMQLAEGLAARNVTLAKGNSAYGEAFTPVIVASEMGADALTWRSLARWLGVHASVFRRGRSSDSPDTAEPAWAKAREALAGQLGEVRRWLRLVDASQAASALRRGPAAFVNVLADVANRWRDTIARAHPNAEIVPVIVIDPVQRYQGSESEIEALNTLARSLCAATVDGKFVTLVTSDTNKQAAKGEIEAIDAEWVAAVFRGSYNLMHEVTAAMAIRATDKGLTEEERQKGVRHLEVLIGKQRWGFCSRPWPRYVWDGPVQRFYAMTESDSARSARDEEDAVQAEKDEKKAARKRSASTEAEAKGETRGYPG
jgi:hypothetical protein